jgi:hypothetical protein
MGDGRWDVVGGRWQVACGRWHMVGGIWDVAAVSPQPALLVGEGSALPL